MLRRPWSMRPRILRGGRRVGIPRRFVRISRPAIAHAIRIRERVRGCVDGYRSPRILQGSSDADNGSLNDMLARTCTKRRRLRKGDAPGGYHRHSMAAPATHAATEGRGVGGVRGQPVERLLRVECPPEHLFRIQGRLVRLLLRWQRSVGRLQLLQLLQLLELLEHL